jgi:hypothetical protein
MVKSVKKKKKKGTVNTQFGVFPNAYGIGTIELTGDQEHR